jgi:hypothetical protein
MGRAAKFLTALALGLAVAASAGAALAHPDLQGVWVISKRSTRGYLDAAMKPLTALPYTPFGAALKAKADPAFDPSARCLNMFPRFMGWPYPLQVVQTPKLTVILFEADTTYREIYTDGRKHNPDDDPTWMGHSVGHWEGDVLVVDTVGVKDTAWLDGDGVPLSDQLHVVERFSLQDQGKTLEDLMTIEDPKIFTAPIVKRLVYNLKADWSLMEYVCEEGNRDNVYEQKAGEPGSLRPVTPPASETPK